MATGGWIAKKVIITDATVGHDPATIPSAIVKMCADALVDTQQGWAVDSAYVVGGVTTPETYHTYYNSSSTYAYGAVTTLTNTTYQAQIAIGYTLYASSSPNSSTYKASPAKTRGTIAWTGHEALTDYYCEANGLWIQYIPNPSATGFFDTSLKPYDEAWAPTKALPWVGGWCNGTTVDSYILATKRATPYVYGGYGNPDSSFIHNGHTLVMPRGTTLITNLLASIQYTIFVITNGTSVMMVQVGDGTNLSTSTNPQALLFSGKLFDSLTNPTDESGTINAKYGCFTNSLNNTHPFSMESRANVLPYTGTQMTDNGALCSGLIACFNKLTDSPSDFVEKHVGGTYGSSTMNLGSTSSYSFVGGDIRGINPAFHASTADNAVRYSKIQLGWYTSDIEHHGVTSYDCIKGYIDANTMIAVPPGVLAPWQLLDSGKMIYVGGGVAIGWDASNDPPF